MNVLNLSDFAKLYSLTSNDLIGKSRKKHIAEVRELYWYLLRNEKYSFSRIAEMFNRQQHGTIISGVKRIKGLIEAKDTIILKLYNMSKKQQILIIEPKGEAICEEYTFSDFACPYCNGRGGFDQSGYLAKFKKNFDDPDWIVCKVCLGNKKIYAEVTVEWYPAGSDKRFDKTFDL